ncbi:MULTISPECIES: hypothetical protein [Bacillus]|uniref:hypothetical protein n=1 Tax=Bacillus TaxID=1386 RepID=UPI00298ED869|nr:hypothetical protein [Bacillus gobiensis]
MSKVQLEGIAFAKKYMDLFLKHATIQRNFELYGLYWAVNTLSLPPSEIMNSKILSMVLHASEEGKQFLSELSQQYALPLDEILNKIIPAFSKSSSEPIQK